MTDTITESKVPSAAEMSAAGTYRTQDGQNRREWSHVAYYRLRCIALETRVEALEEKLRQTERQTREIVTRYEQILQDRPDGVGGVVAPSGPLEDG